jgi:hypothetical protein
MTKGNATPTVNIPLTADQKNFLLNLQRKLLLKQNQIMALQQELPRLAKDVNDGIQSTAKICNIQPGFDFDEDLNIVAVSTT